MDKNFISRIFLFFLIIFIVYFCYLIFKPFLVEIIAAAVLVSIFYTPYEWLTKRFGGRKHLAALVMCVLVAILVIVPLANFLVYAAQKSIVSYGEIIRKVNTENLSGFIKDSSFVEKFNYLGIDSSSFKGVLLDIAKKLKDWLVSGGTNFIMGTTNFIISLILIIFTMFFFFIDGQRMIKKLMYLTPLSNKYDKEIFKKFRDVSSSTIVSTFVICIAQGLIGGLGFLVVGLPALFFGIVMSFAALLPYLGSALIWFPAAIYLLASGQIWQGIFLLVLGFGIISTIDNVIRAYIIKGKSEVHPIFIVFSVLGGIALFGFWGAIFGPLIISLAVTIFHIYELEYEKVLEK